MAEDKQLTVAELLARARKDNPDAGQPRRRRRRSLEDGGISVAELTGSFPAVTAAPAEAKHTAVSIDGEEKPASISPTTPPAEPKPESVPEVDTPAEEEPTPEPEPELEPEVAPAPEAAVEPEPEPEPEPELELEVAPVPEAAVEPEPEPVLEDSAPTGVIQKIDLDDPAPAPEETGVMPALVPAERPAATPAPRPDPTPEPEEAAGTETAAGGLGPVLLMAAVGIIVGIIVFIVFEQLWGALNPWLTGMLALLVTAAMVIAVRALDTTRNSLTMILAGLVGLATAFAPALIAL